MRDVTTGAMAGLERLCAARNVVRAGSSRPGFERLEASFGTLAFSPHRHDSYAIGVTLRGVQSFGYRGTTQHSEAGCAFVIHPDETHDGRAGTDDGFGYRIIYIEPRLIAAALGGRPLPFVRDAVTCESRLHRAICDALEDLDAPLDDAPFDGMIAALADALAAHDPSVTMNAVEALARDAVQTARLLLDDQPDISSAVLERATGLSRFELARHFRKCLGTSPHRYTTMRRLGRAKQLMAGGHALAESAAAAGFADQCHMTRQFRKAYGVSPGQWRALTQH